MPFEFNRNVGALLHQLLTQSAKAELAPWQNELIKHDDLFKTFIKFEIEYKGQMVSGYSIRGGGVKISASFDFGECLCPGSTASVGVSGSVTSARALILIISRLPKSLETFATDNPILFTCMHGVIN